MQCFDDSFDVIPWIFWCGRNGFGIAGKFPSTQVWAIFFRSSFKNWHLRVFAGIHGFFFNIPDDVYFGRPREMPKSIIFPFPDMYSDAEFDVDSDFAIKRTLKVWSEWAIDIWNNYCETSQRTFWTTTWDVKINYFSNPVHVIWCRIRCRFWFFHQAYPEVMIWLSNGRSKSMTL